MDAGQFDSAGVHLRDALSAPIRDELQLSLAYALTAMLAQQAGDTAAIRQAVEAAVAADTRAGIAGASVWARGMIR